MKNIKFSLAWQILFAMVLGILLGSYLHYHSDSRDWLVVNLLSPAGDISTKEKAQQAIGLNMEQIKAEKQDFIKTVIPQWEEQARKNGLLSQ